MRVQFVEALLRKSVSSSKISTPLLLNLCWCISEACKYKNRNHNGGHDNFLLNYNIGWKKHTADLALIATGFSQGLLQEIFMSKWWLSSKIKLGTSLNANF